MKYRIEKDTLGEVEVPVDVYYGPQTQRSVNNFKIATDIIRMLTCWIMGTAHNAGVNVIFHNLLFHVGKVHAPYIFLVFFQSTVYNVVSIISKSPGKSHISWRMHQHAVPF